jgi:hypothetical protein
MSYLLPFDGSVVDGREAEEVVYAKEQPEYIPLRCLVTDREHTGKVTSRWTLTPEQRIEVFEGADIFLSLLTFGQPLQPIQMQVGNYTENG